MISLYFKYIRLLLLVLVVVIAGCTSAGENNADLYSHDPAALLNKTWQWEATVTPVEKISVAQPDRYTIQFAANGKLKAKFDCNAGGGNYTLSGSQLTFGPLISTRMACPQDSQDAEFMRDLQRVHSFFFKDGMLFLELALDSGTMRFKAKP